LLVVLPQFPHDPASGAARTATTVGELMAQAGFAVEIVATTATEGQSTPVEEALNSSSHLREDGVFRYRKRGVNYSLVDTGDASPRGWTETHQPTYDRLFDKVLFEFRPNIVFTYGGSPADVALQNRATAGGARVVFGLYNTRYLKPGVLDHVAAVVTPSEFLSRLYRDAVGLRTTSLPTPLLPDDVLCDQVEALSLTIVNPTMDKGLIVFLSLVAAFGRQGASIPIDVYPSRGTMTFIIRAALACGVDLAAHPNVVIHATEQTPAAIYRRTRILIAPSLVEDAAPRVIAEALANGIPALGSNRGGIPEMCAHGGYVLPVPHSIGPCNFEVLSGEVLAPWVELILTLFEKQEVWRAASVRARAAGEKYLPPFVIEPYQTFFEGLLG
jgi:glycosyltransferase involved in cell wall biosynthesis